MSKSLISTIETMIANSSGNPSWLGTEEIIEEVIKLLSEDRLSIVSGGQLAAFEERCADFWGNRHGLAFSSGTGAIHSALFALGVGRGDEVIVPTYGYHAMVTPVLLLGATPVFCDVSVDSLAVEPEDIDRVRTRNTRGVIVLHPWGNLADLPRLRVYTKQTGLFLVSDASHAHGASFNGAKIGSYSDITCASFGKDKLVSGGELGSATTDDPELWDRMAMFSHPNRVPSDFKLPERAPIVSNSIGTKYRPHALALVVGTHRLKIASERLSTLSSLVANLTRPLVAGSAIKLQGIYPGVERVHWKIILIGRGDRGDYVIDRLKMLADTLHVPIERNHYAPLLHQAVSYVSYYRVPSCRKHFPKAESNLNRIVQIHAPSLFDQSKFALYSNLFLEFNQKMELFNE